MKKFFNIFFISLGIIFFILILLGLYLYITDPFNIKPLIFGEESSEQITTDGVDKNSMLNESQEAVLENLGVDPASIPNQISQEQESCFVEKLGSKRVNEIKAGDIPSAIEIFKAKDCI